MQTECLTTTDHSVNVAIMAAAGAVPFPTFMGNVKYSPRVLRDTRQAAIMEDGWLKQGLYRTRQRNANAVMAYPLGSRADHAPQQGELLFIADGTKGAPALYATFNGLTPDQATKAVFFGVSPQSVDPARCFGAADVKFACQAGGTEVIRNTGRYTIQLGDVVYWDIPNVQGVGGDIRPSCQGPLNQNAERQMRFVPATIPFRKLKEYIKNAWGGVATGIQARLLHPNRRVGVALSPAKPGHPFTINLE